MEVKNSNRGWKNASAKKHILPADVPVYSASFSSLVMSWANSQEIKFSTTLYLMFRQEFGRPVLRQRHSLALCGASVRGKKENVRAFVRRSVYTLTIIFVMNILEITMNAMVIRIREQNMDGSLRLPYLIRGVLHQ